jgi:hypothetical protein
MARRQFEVSSTTANPRGFSEHPSNPNSENLYPSTHRSRM